MSRVVPDGEVVDAALDVADEIAANSPFGVWMTKEVMWSQLEIGVAPGRHRPREPHADPVLDDRRHRGARCGRSSSSDRSAAGGSQARRLATAAWPRIERPAARIERPHPEDMAEAVTAFLRRRAASSSS